MAKLTTKDTDGTSHHGVEIHTTVAKLTEALGAPQYNNEYADDKVNYVWDCETKDGDVFTIYDWKNYRKLQPDELLIFNIGSLEKNVSDQAWEELIEILK